MNLRDYIERAADQVVAQRVQQIAEDVGDELRVPNLRAMITDDGVLTTIRIDGPDFQALSIAQREEVAQRVVERVLSAA